MTPFRCAVASAERHEPLFATASRVDRWLLVEHPGAWSRETVPRSRLEGVVITALEQLGEPTRARLVLIRRPRGASAPGRRLFFADSRPGRERLLTRSIERDAELLSLGLPDSEPQAWTPVPPRLLLVCTHGRHDPCCAIWGRPVAQALAARYPAETWECTHIGGDRFAPNVVALPEGYYFGRVPAAEAAEVVGLLDAGRLAGRYLRGRSSLGLLVQAAQHFARTALANDDAHDLSPVASERLDSQSWRVRLRSAAGGEVAVTVRRVLQEPPQRLTCHSAAPQPSPAFELLELSSG